MVATIDKRQIEAKVMEKQQAIKKYADAVKSGHTAVVVKDMGVDFHQLDIGNLLPGQTASVEITLLQPLHRLNNTYEFSLPMSYFPKY